MHGLKRRGLETEHQPPRQSPTLLKEEGTGGMGGAVAAGDRGALGPVARRPGPPRLAAVSPAAGQEERKTRNGW